MTNYILSGHSAEPCDDLHKWAEWFETADRQVARDTIGDADVSTVFLGNDRAFGHGTPVLFETMVFGGDMDQEQDRYCTWDEAEAGHQALCARVRALGSNGLN